MKRNWRQKLFLLYKNLRRPFSGHGWGNAYLLKVINKFIVAKLRTVVEVQGHRMYLDSNDSLGLFERDIYEPHETRVVTEVVKQGDLVLDIGAHIGYYTLILAKLVGPNGKVFAFEPNPKNFSLLSMNVKANSYQNVVLMQKAVSEKSGAIKLYLSEDSGDGRVFYPHNDRETLNVEAVRIDDCLQGFGKDVSFIKMDVQGAELGVLSGMRLLLKRNRELTILTEFWPTGLKLIGDDPKLFLLFMIEHGFKLYHLDDRSHSRQLINIDTPLAGWMPTTRSYANLLCVRN